MRTNPNLSSIKSSQVKSDAYVDNTDEDYETLLMFISEKDKNETQEINNCSNKDRVRDKDGEHIWDIKECFLNSRELQNPESSMENRQKI